MASKIYAVYKTDHQHQEYFDRTFFDLQDAQDYLKDDYEYARHRYYIKPKDWHDMWRGMVYMDDLGHNGYQLVVQDEGTCCEAEYANFYDKPKIPLAARVVPMTLKDPAPLDPTHGY